MTIYDVCVLGGGPAGATIALRLTELGRSVLLIEKQATPPDHIGLSLSTGILHWLNLLGIDRQVNQASFKRAQRSLIWWDSPQPLLKEFSQEKAGYHVNRSLFDEILLKKAKSKGVKVIRPASILKLKKIADHAWLLKVKKDKKVLSFKASFLVEATGRASMISKKRKAILAPTLATYAYCEGQSDTSFVEAGINGWHWGAPVSDKGFLFCTFTDPQSLKQADSVDAFYTQQLSSSKLARAMNIGEQVTKVSVCTATAYANANLISPYHISIGDAAFSMDPISSQGVQKAIKSAFQGAIVVNTMLAAQGTSNDAQALYRQIIDREILDHRGWVTTFYSRQNIYPNESFWELRSKAKTKEISTDNDYTISLKHDSLLRFNPEFSINATSVLGKAFLERRQAIFDPCATEPYVFVEGVGAVTLIKRLDGKTLNEAAQVISELLPHVKPVKIIRWLLYRRILTPVSEKVFALP